MDKDGILDVSYPKKEGEKTFYSLTPKGVDLAISMVNLDYSKKIINLTEAIIIKNGFKINKEKIIDTFQGYYKQLEKNEKLLMDKKPDYYIADKRIRQKIIQDRDQFDNFGALVKEIKTSCDFEQIILPTYPDLLIFKYI